MKKIAVLVTNYFEDSEYTSPVETLNQAGHEIVNLGLKEGEIVTGKKEGTEVVIDQDVKEATADQFDALLLPGGFSPDILRAKPEPVDFVRNFVRSGKPVFAICHGPQLMITADVLRGRTLTGWKSIEQDIKNAGANFEDKEVVVDDNLVTSRNPDDLPAFNQAILNQLRE